MTHVRYEIIAILFLVMTINQADRATMSIAGTPLSRDVGLTHAGLGWLFSTFAWSYMLCQLIGGWAIDRYGARLTLGVACFAWSIATGLIGAAPWLGPRWAVPAIFILMFLLGAAAAPSFPFNSKIVAAWFPAEECSTASALFNATQYFAAAVFLPLLGWIAFSFGWRTIYFVMGALGIVAGFVFVFRVTFPIKTKWLGKDEYTFLQQHGATLIPAG